jgi:putative hydrolase of the HAD superfamily
MCLFNQIETRMNAYVQQVLNVDKTEADHLRATYWAEHGTTLAGLMRNHDIDPDPYLIAVHDVDFTVLSPDPALRSAIKNLPGHKVIYTNGTAPYARNVLAARGLSDLWDNIYGVEHAHYHPKPDHAAYARVFKTQGLDPHRSAMFEDDPRNLEVPHKMGLRTIHVAPRPHSAPFIQHHTDDLAGFLSHLV